MLGVVDALPVRTSGKVDRAALPWPLPGVDTPAATDFSADEAWLAEQWQAVLGLAVTDRKADFFDLGGGSLAAAQLVSRIRARVPEFSVADIYDVPRLGAMAKALGPQLHDETPSTFHRPAPTPRSTQWVQTLVGAPLFLLSGIRWLLYLLTASAILQLTPGFEVLPDVPWPVLVAGLLIFATRSDAWRSPWHPLVFCSRGCGRATIRAEVRCTSACGSPSRSRIKWMPSAWPARPGCRTTRERSARGSAATSICTPFRPSRDSSSSETGRRSSPRST